MSINQPQRGQPIDYDFLSTIVNEVNNISSSINPRAESKFNNGTNKVSVKSSQMIFAAGYHIPWSSAENAKVGQEKSFTYTFDTSFKYPPIVTITPVSLNTSTASKDISIVVTSVTETAVTGSVLFRTAGAAKIGLNIIAAGIPN